MIRNFFERNMRAVNQVTMFVLTVLIVYFFVRYLLYLFAPFLTGWIISVILSRPVRFINKKAKIPRAWAGILCLILFLTVVLYAGNAIIVQIVNQFNGFRLMVPTYSDQLIFFFDSISEWFYSFSDILPEYAIDAIDKSFSALITNVTSMLGTQFKDGSLSVVSSLPNILIFIIVTIVSTIFLIRDKELIELFISRQIPEKWKNTIAIVKRSLSKFIGGYLKAQMMVACVCFCIVFVGFLLLGYQHALIIALLIAFVDLLPILGSGFILWPWIGYSIFISDYAYAVGLGLIYLSVQISRQSLEPRLVGHSVGLHPIVTLTAMFAGLKAFGFVGLAVFPIIIITIKSLQQENLLPRWK